MNRKLIAMALALGATSLPVPQAGAVESPTVTERFMQMFEREAAAAGVALEQLFEQPATVTVYGEHGASVSTRTFGEVVEMMTPDLPSEIVAGEGPLGTPEYVAGNITHLFGSLWFGPDDEADANCQQVTVKQSATVPNTYAVASQVASAAGVPLINPVPVTLLPLLLTPVPGALSPVIPYTSYILPAYVWLGPTIHVKGKYTFGLHEVGTLIGSNASTATGAPSPYPVWAPMTTLGFVQDTSVDFLGQGLFTHAESRASFFGYTLCGGLGLMLLSNGAAIFDNHPVLGLDVGLPDVP